MSRAQEALTSSESAMQRVNTDTWEGLNCRFVSGDEWDALFGDARTDSLLVLHTAGSANHHMKLGSRNWVYESKPDRFDYLVSGQYVAQRTGDDSSVCCVISIPNAFESAVLDETAGDPPVLPRFQFHDRRLRAMVDALLETTRRQPTGSVEAVMLSVATVDRLHEALALRHQRVRAARFSATIRRLVIEYLDMNVGSRHDIDQIAMLTGLARTSSAIAFRDAFGVSIHQYLIHRRVETAQRMLSESKMTVTQLAHDLGFSSHAHFTTVFRQRTGMTPSMFRQRQEACCANAPACAQSTPSQNGI